MRSASRSTRPWRASSTRLVGFRNADGESTNEMQVLYTFPSALDLTKPEAKEIVFELVRWADVVCESFSPKAMRGWGLAYDDLVQVKPDLIMASSCLFGQSKSAATTPMNESAARTMKAVCWLAFEPI